MRPRVARAMAKDTEGLRGLLGLASREVAIAGVRSVAVTAGELSWTPDCVVNISLGTQSKRHTKDNVLRWHALNPLRSHKLVEARPWFV
jgi:hypothetical protein